MIPTSLGSGGGSVKVTANPFEVKDRYRDMLLALPNVTGVAVGRKRVDGKDVVAIKVFVNKWVELERLNQEECVPKEIEGIPTDVEEIGRLLAY